MAELETTVVNEIERVNREVEKMSGEILAIKINSQADFDSAVGSLTKIKEWSKRLSEKKDLIIRPLNQSIKEIRELFRTPETRLSEAETALKKAIVVYQSKIEKKAEKKAVEIEQKNADGKLDLNQSIEKMSKINRMEGKVKTESGSVQFRVIRKVKIINIAEIPARYFANEKVLDALRIAVSKDALNGIVIPGVEVYEEKQVAA